jgi:integrase/recombinase XerC/integrase/recombinase XerD
MALLHVLGRHPLKGRKSGPVFVTERKARVQRPASDLDEHGHARLSYQQAAALFSEASGRDLQRSGNVR